MVSDLRYIYVIYIYLMSIRHISEVIDGIGSVKSYAWETPFFYMIKELRTIETKYIGIPRNIISFSIMYLYIS